MSSQLCFARSTLCINSHRVSPYLSKHGLTTCMSLVMIVKRLILFQAINVLENHEQQAMNVSGRNGIGIFNFTYCIQNMDYKYKNECNSGIPGGNGTDHLPTSPQTDISFTPADNCTNQQVHESSSPPWPWIAVAVLFILLTILLLIIIIVVICIVKNMRMNVKETKNRDSCEIKGECLCSTLNACNTGICLYISFELNTLVYSLFNTLRPIIQHKIFLILFVQIVICSTYTIPSYTISSTHD